MSNVRQLSFGAGELAPSLWARTDVVKYATGLRTCRNFFVARHGSVENRPGSEYLCTVKDSTKTTRLLKFVFNADQTYILEFGNQYIRFVQDGAQVNVGTVTAWSNATNYPVGALASRLGVNYYCILAHTNQQPPNATYWHPLTGAIYEIPTPYVTADLFGLKIVQSADVITITHPSYPPSNLSRMGATTWTLVPITFAPGIAAPVDTVSAWSSVTAYVSGDVAKLSGVNYLCILNHTNHAPPNATYWTALPRPEIGVSLSGGTNTAQVTTWAVTALADETGEESLPAYSFASFLNTHTPDPSNPTTVSWTAVPGAAQYNIYRSNPVASITDVAVTFGYLGTSAGTSFADYGATPVTSIAPPTARNPFPGAGDYPSAAGYYQQRRLFADTTNHPETVYASRSANFNNFTVSSPSQDDDAITFTLVGRQVNQVQHLVDLGKLLVLTSGSIWSCEGGQDGVLLPSAINSRQQSVHGSNELPPILLGTSMLYVQARGSIIRDLTQDPIQGYRGNDLTIFSAHLFDGHTLVEWDYQETPDSIIWIVRSDGVLLGLTYVPEHALWGWHRHDTDGVYESICTVPEGDQDSVYVIVKRTINGNTVRYIERFANRHVTDQRDACFLDASLAYNGWNTDLTNSGIVGLVNGTTWDQYEDIQLNANSNQFTSGDVGNAIFLIAADGTEVRCTITSYVSATEVFVRPNRSVPLDLRGVGTTAWARAVDTLSGLSHVEGETVGVYADGYVVASPNNDSYTPITVTGGSITLDRPYAMIRVGLPYVSDFETLDIDTPQGASLKDKGMNVSRVGLFVEASRGIFAGRQFPTGTNPLDGLQEFKARNAEGYDDFVTLKTDFIDIPIASNWNNNGRIVVRQVDPLPLAILSVVPQGYLPVGG